MEKYMVVLKYIIMNPLFLFVLVSLSGIYVVKYCIYKKSAYCQMTKNSYISVLFNKGRMGEYETYARLKRFEREGGRFLFNTYIPKENGETSEIDVILIHKKSIFVFESKNYSGWIFGDEKQHKWTQVLPKGKGKSKKERFYNPIMQNKSHIKHLKKIIGEDIPVVSVIVFSDRCTLKKVTVISENVSVINRYNILKTVKSICKKMQEDNLNEYKIESIYNKLYPYTQVSKEFKEQHIEKINEKNMKTK